MSKTTYSAPSMKVYVMEAESMICTSGDSNTYNVRGSENGGSIFDPPTPSEANERGTYEW